ncbi:MAG: dTDP-4-dehydrorhamnose reductase [Chitinophagaceae bacterium]|nr:dTDP-4-dehydrorhamnose reductase [Chitinophagaceae bacterium]
MSTTTQSKRPLVLVTGANGQLGKELRQLETKWPEFEFLFLSREDLPIHHFELVRNFFKATHPSFLINCAAYTAVDKAEQEKELAFQINAEAVGVLAAICKEQDCKFVHVSTDYVFDGLANRPYREDDLTNPQGVYGASKLAGEKEAVLLNPDSVIIRTSWVYSSFGKNFVKTILRLLQEKPSVSVVDDQIGSPTYAADLAVAILEIISLKSWKPGVYHFSNEGEISWCAFAKAIAALTHSNTPVQAITTAEFPTPAKRPAWSVLDKSKIKAVYGIKIRPWKESLADCLELLSK